MILQTPRLVLREFIEEDFDAFALLMADPEVMRFSLSGPLSREQAKHYFQTRILSHYSAFKFGLWAVIFEKNIIGFVGLVSQEVDGEKKNELGYRLLPKY